MSKENFDYLTLYYKIFIVFLIIAQVYSVLFLAVNPFTITVNFIVMFYLLFRFYLLVNLSRKAKKKSMSLPEFLLKSKIDCKLCKTNDEIKF